MPGPDHASAPQAPASSFIRFVAKLPNETWQIDATPWQLADGRSVEILEFESLDPTRSYQPLGGRWPVHNVLRQVSSMS